MRSPCPCRPAVQMGVRLTVAKAVIATAAILAAGSFVDTADAHRHTVWDRLAECESGGRWAYNGSSGFDGGLQFHPQTWSAYRLRGYPRFAWQAPRWKQICVALRVLWDQGWGAWPACSRKLGLR